MPKTLTYGTESAANKAIGGVPKIHYFDFQSRGRGQAVRLLLIDAGAAYEDVRYSFDEWPQYKRSEAIKSKNPTGNIPIIEMPGGKILTQSYAILRHWARQLGAYDGKTEDEKYYADVVCDIVVDWRTLFIDAFFSDDKQDYEKHKSGTRAHYLSAIEQSLKGSDVASKGPYITGTEFTYADVVLFQIVHDENLLDGGLKDYPRIAQVAEAVRSRPNVKKFLASDSYLG